MPSERYPLADALDVQLRVLERDEEDHDGVAALTRLAQHVDLGSMRHHSFEGEADALFHALLPRLTCQRLRAQRALFAGSARKGGIDVVGVDLPAQLYAARD
jgi:hypothetical protein